MVNPTTFSMWNKIKLFVFESEKPEVVRIVYLRDLEQLDKVAKAAMEHYCESCDTAFKNRGSKKNHVRLRHPEMYIKPTSVIQNDATSPIADQELPQAE